MALRHYCAAWLVRLSSMAWAQDGQFDELVRQIESGERYFFSIADYKTALTELQNALPAGDI